MNSQIQLTIVDALRRLTNQSWQKAEIVIDFPPTINRGYKGTQLFINENNEKVKLSVMGDEIFNTQLYQHIYLLNQTGEYNRIRIVAFRENIDATSIQVSFEPTLVEEFESFLPKSKKGKTIPWWKNPDEIKAIGL
jgi:hypothetical protein